MSENVKSKLTLLAKIGVATGLVLFLVKSGHLDLGVVWKLMTVRNIAVALALGGMSTLLAAWRWILLLQSRGFKIPISYGFSLYLIGMFFNYALPGSVSGDLVRGYYLVQDHPERKMDSVLSVLIDRILGLYSFFILSLLAIACDLAFVLAHEQIRWLAMLCLLIFLGMTGFFILSFSTRLYRLSGLDFVVCRVQPLHRLMQGFQRFGQNRKILAVSVLVSVLAQLFCLSVFYYLGFVLNEPGATWQSILFAVPMGFVVTAVPIAPAGVGVGQVAFLYLFQTYMNKTSQFGAISITIFQLTNAVWSLVGVIFYLRRRKPHELDNMQSKMEMIST
jgi:uncharacterized protein (TIRG00374 family)